MELTNNEIRMMVVILDDLLKMRDESRAISKNNATALRAMKDLRLKLRKQGTFQGAFL